MASAASASVQEAEKLWLQKLVASPDGWRGRAASAGGLLSAAAAAALFGLLSRNGSSVNGVLRLMVEVTAAAYVLAVGLFLAASVYPAKKLPSTITTNYIQEMETRIGQEVRPIRRLALAGSTFAVLAVVGTGLTSTLLLTSKPQYSKAVVHLKDNKDATSLRQLCPRVKDSFDAGVSRADQGEVTLRLAPGSCGTDAVYIHVHEANLIARFTEDG